MILRRSTALAHGSDEGEPAVRETAPPEAGGGTDQPEPIPDAALDAVAAILRVLGETASRDPDAAATLEAWARHILVLTSPPGSEKRAGRTRNWTGLSSHVVAHVRAEHAAVSGSIGDLQDAIWLVIERLSHAIAGDAASDAVAMGQLERLREATGRSAAELKATALETVDRLSELIDEKSSRQLQLARELGERVTDLKVELEHTRRDADIDPLTKLWNRGVFQRELPRTVHVCTLVDQPACLVLIDIDHFKQINDAHGHTAGDTALEATACTLVRSFPRRGDFLTRFGGDEFAVILNDATVTDGARLAERFVAAVREIEVPGPREPVKITASVGVAEALAGESADSWLARADRALYEAKAGGRDGVAIAPGSSLDRPQAAA